MQNKLGIIFLSDIHFKSEDDYVISNIQSIVNRIKNKCLDADEIVIIVSGDIVFSGEKSQFEIAYYFFDDLKNELEKYIKKNINILFSQGNHDSKFEEDNLVRPIIINSVLKGERINQSTIDACCLPQQNFYEFEELFLNDTLDTKFKDKLLTIKSLKIKSKAIYFITYNTAWLSQVHEEQGKVYFPIDLYKDELEKYKDGIVISIFHHPTKWHDSDKANYFDCHVEKISDIILSGHEHTQDNFFKRRNLDEVVYIKAEALQEDSNTKKSKFCYVEVDTEKNKLKIERYEFKCDIGKYSATTQDEYTFNTLNNNKMENFKLKKDFVDYLKDIGVNFKHPRKEQLFLQDIFVYPMLEEVIFDKSFENGESILLNTHDIFEKTGIIILYGDDNSGKTSICKMFFSEYFSKGKYPLLIDGKKINANSIKNSEKLISNIFEEQYNGSYDLFIQEDMEKIILLIDDFHKCDLNDKQKILIISRLVTKYPNIIILVDSEIEINNLFQKGRQTNENLEFQQYRIKKFGYQLRSKLVHKWNMIGFDDYENNIELQVKDDNAIKRITTLIGKNYIPAVPFYLITMLQAFEVGNEHRLTDSAYGYYYEYLILQSINSIINEQGSVDAFQNFMIYMAKYFYYENKKSLSYDEFQEIHAKFCKEYRIGESFRTFKKFNILLENFLKVNIILEENNVYKFRYKYIYYYCIGKYLGREIDDDDVRKKIKDMIENLYVEEYANIVMFIIHHTKNKYILNELLKNINLMFYDREMVTLESDSKYLSDEYIVELPKLVVKNITVEKYREKTLEKNDKLLSIEESEEACTEFENVDDSKDISILNQFNYSFKGMEILGQILKNYWGSLTGDLKTEIGVELYSVGLRVLRETYITLENAESELVDIISKNLEEKNNIQTEEIEIYTRKMILLFTAFYSHACIEKVADCVGDDKLSETFKDIETKLNYNSVKLINLSIKLQYFRGKFPYDYVETLMKENKKNPVVKFLIANMVKNHLYMYEKSYSDKMKIASLVGLEIVKDSERKKLAQKIKH